MAACFFQSLVDYEGDLDIDVDDFIVGADYDDDEDDGDGGIGSDFFRSCDFFEDDDSDVRFGKALIIFLPCLILDLPKKGLSCCSSEVLTLIIEASANLALAFYASQTKRYCSEA